jgi:hypothetical protein
MMKELFEKLKQRLRERESSYVEHHSMCGDTESGFHDEDIFDIDKLMAEIDEFAETFKPGGANQPDSTHPKPPAA